METYDAVIIGGGIGGLTLSLKLARKDIKVLLVEKIKQPAKLYKGELLQPKSLEYFQDMGVAEGIVNASLSLSSIYTYEMAENNDGTIRRKASIPLHYNLLPGQFPEARMIPHETLKKLLLTEASRFDSFYYWNPATFQRFTDADLENEHFNKAEIQFEGEKKHVQARFFIGAEGRSSLMRKAMDQHVVTRQYNHQFLTASFPRPVELNTARIYASHKSFIGLFPLPDNKVRSVMLIKPGQYKQMKKEGIHTFYEPFERFEPLLEGYPQAIKQWKDIQLMIPISHNIKRYVKGNAAIIGDAAHTVHPMAGEGMNLAIQDASVLGELLTWMFQHNQLEDKHLKMFEKIRKKRADRLSRLSHLSALGYTLPYKWFQKGRIFALKQLSKHPVLHYKHMLNVSGIGWWPYNLLDILRFIGPSGSYSRERFQRHRYNKLFSEKNDFPWK